ncbi:uncharacterized protein METZ01_LOCUS294944, partial [marine metagenome]
VGARIGRRVTGSLQDVSDAPADGPVDGPADRPDSVEAPSHSLSGDHSVGGPAFRRTWPQRLLIGVNILLALGLFAGASRLASFEEAVGSIIRIDVPAGVLADLDVP